MQWHYKKGDVWIGPISDEEKERLVKLGVLTCDTLISVCHDSFDFVPSNPSDQDERAFGTSDSDERKENGKYYYYGVHSEGVEEREFELAAKKFGFERTSDSEEEEDGNWSTTDEEEFWDEEEEGGDDDEFNWTENDEEFDAIGEAKSLNEDEDNNNDLEVVDDEEDWDEDEDNDEDSKVVDDEEDENDDVLAVPLDDQQLFELSDYPKDSEEKFDELTVMPDSDIDDEEDEEDNDEFDLEDDSGVDDLSLLDDGDAERNQADATSDLSRRLEDVEEKLEQVSEDFGAFSTDSDSRLDSLEEQTGDLKDNYEKLGSDVKALSVKFVEKTNDWSIRFVELTRDQKSVEVGLERIRKNFGVLLNDGYGRLDALEKKTKTLDKDCENFAAGITSLSVKISTFNADDWKFRFDDQAERVAIVQEKLTGIQRKINGEVEEKNRRLVDLEEKTGNCEKASQVIGARINSLSGAVSSCKNLIDGQKNGLLLASTRLGELEEIINELRRLVNANVQRQEFVELAKVVNELRRNVQGQEFIELEEAVNDLRRLVNTNVQTLSLIEQEAESASTAVSVQRGIVNGVCDRIDQLETTVQNILEAQKKFEQNYASLTSFGDLEKKLDALRSHCNTQEQSVKTINEALEKNDKRTQERVGLLDNQIKDISNNWERERSLQLKELQKRDRKIAELVEKLTLEQKQRTEELQKRDQRITTIVENFVQFQEKHSELQTYANSLEKKIDNLTVKMVVNRSRTEASDNADGTQTPTEAFWERWGGEFITNGKFRMFVLVSSVGLLFLLFEILRLFFK